MNGVTFPVQYSDSDDPAVEEVDKLVAEATSLEHFVLLTMQRYYKLRVSKMYNPGDGCELAVFEVLNDNLGAKKESFAFVNFSAEELRESHRFQRLNETILNFDDSDQYQPDNEWFEARSDRLRIKVDEFEGEVIAPAAALAELILSYALSSCGLAEVSHQMAETRNGVHEVARLNLRFLEPKTERGWVETINVRLDRLEGLVRKRRERDFSLVHTV